MTEKKNLKKGDLAIVLRASKRSIIKLKSHYLTKIHFRRLRYPVKTPNFKSWLWDKNIWKGARGYESQNLCKPKLIIQLVNQLHRQSFNQLISQSSI